MALAWASNWSCPPYRSTGKLGLEAVQGRNGAPGRDSVESDRRRECEVRFRPESGTRVRDTRAARMDRRAECDAADNRDEGKHGCGDDDRRARVGSAVDALGGCPGGNHRRGAGPRRSRRRAGAHAACAPRRADRDRREPVGRRVAGHRAPRADGAHAAFPRAPYRGNHDTRRLRRRRDLPGRVDVRFRSRRDQGAFGRAGRRQRRRLPEPRDRRLQRQPERRRVRDHAVGEPSRLSAPERRGGTQRRFALVGRVLGRGGKPRRPGLVRRDAGAVLEPAVRTGRGSGGDGPERQPADRAQERTPDLPGDRARLGPGAVQAVPGARRVVRGHPAAASDLHHALRGDPPLDEHGARRGPDGLRTP